MTLGEGIGQFLSTFRLVLFGGLKAQVPASSCAIYPGRIKSGAGALVDFRMLDQLTLHLVWRHLELAPLTGGILHSLRRN